MPAKSFVALGGVLAALGVGLGAIGAHVLKSHLAPVRIEAFHTAVEYQMFHAIGLVLVGLLSMQVRNPWFHTAGWAMTLGIVLFSGGIYAWIATELKPFMFVVPFGGVSFIVGWLALAGGGLRASAAGESGRTRKNTAC